MKCECEGCGAPLKASICDYCKRPGKAQVSQMGSEQTLALYGYANAYPQNCPQNGYGISSAQSQAQIFQNAHSQQQAAAMSSAILMTYLGG